MVGQVVRVLGAWGVAQLKYPADLPTAAGGDRLSGRSEVSVELAAGDRAPYRYAFFSDPLARRRGVRRRDRRKRSGDRHAHWSDRDVHHSVTGRIHHRLLRLDRLVLDV